MKNNSIEKIFNEVIKEEPSLPVEARKALDIIIDRAEHNKAVLTVIITSLYKKIITPEQDTRYHQAGMPGGYSGRGLDTKEITPFLKKKKFPAMASGTGWLTRSLEQAGPYDKNFLGRITPSILKESFLKIFTFIEEDKNNPKPYLGYIFKKLIEKRDSTTIGVERPKITEIKPLVESLEKHFNHKYKDIRGGSQLPVLAVYAVYKIMLDEFDKFEGKTLRPLKSHTSADSRSGAVGDIEIYNKGSDNLFEAVEVKHNIPITEQMLTDSYDKFKTTGIRNYYLLTTSKDVNELDSKIMEIRNNHGCQVIVNGVINTIQYYLRNISDLYLFIDNYATLLEEEKGDAIKYEHRQKWNELFQHNK